MLLQNKVKKSNYFLLTFTIPSTAGVLNSAPSPHTPLPSIPESRERGGSRQGTFSITRNPPPGLFDTPLATQRPGTVNTHEPRQRGRLRALMNGRKPLMRDSGYHIKQLKMRENNGY